MDQNIPKCNKVDVIKTERAIIDKQRELRGNNDADRKLVGLALSGGGIRSASFAVGVLQGLQRFDLLKKVDYLSTVSGGGYIGSSLTWFNYLQRKNPEWKFPFGEQGKGARTDPGKANVLDYLRQHGEYLTPGSGLSTLSLFAMILRASAYVAIVYFSLLIVLMWLLDTVRLFEKVSFFGAKDFLFLGAINYAHLLAVVVLVLSVGFVIAGALLSFRQIGTKADGYTRRILYQRIYGRLLMAVLVLAALGFLPLAFEIKENFSTLSEKYQLKLFESMPAWLSLGMGIVGALYQFVFQRNSDDKRGKLSGLRIWLTACLLIYGLLFAAFFIFTKVSSINPWGVNGIVWLGVAALLAGVFLNVNLFGINRMYRDRLMETFLPQKSAVEKNAWAPASLADEARICDMCGDGALDKPTHGDDGFSTLDNVNCVGPYHLINTNVVLADSKTARFRGRGGDNFVISPAFCGGDALGWHHTCNFLNGEMTLATAMSISGAALNPNTGVGGKGVSRNKLVAFMMGFFNIRLGYWVRNPKNTDAQKHQNAGMPPNLLFPGLVQGLLGHGLHEDARYIELTDGGHFDNTGLYELIRRRVPVIFLSQAGADPDFNLNDIAVAIERVRVDFGIIIRFDFEDFGIDGMIPGSDTDSGFSSKVELAQRGFAVASIEYPGETERGILFVIKSILTTRLPAGLYHYKTTHMTFPNQTTSDQFFDESQLEAYRELGYQLVKQMVGEVKNKPFFETFREPSQ